MTYHITHFETPLKFHEGQEKKPAALESKEEESDDDSNDDDEKQEEALASKIKPAVEKKDESSDDENSLEEEWTTYTLVRMYFNDNPLACTLLVALEKWPRPEKSLMRKLLTLSARDMLKMDLEEVTLRELTA